MVKKITLLVSFLIVTSWIAIDRLGLLRFCDKVPSSRCGEILHDIMLASIIILPVFIFSLLTYKMREEVFSSWLLFTYVWIPFSFAVVLFSGSRQSANIVGLSDQAIFGVFTWGLYILVSLVIIAYKSYRLRGQ